MLAKPVPVAEHDHQHADILYTECISASVTYFRGKLLLPHAEPDSDGDLHTHHYRILFERARIIKKKCRPAVTCELQIASEGKPVNARYVRKHIGKCCARQEFVI